MKHNLTARCILCSILFLSFASVNAATDGRNYAASDTTVVADGNTVFTIVDEMAQFPGGMDALAKFLQTNLMYPAAARKTGTQGTVFVSFVIHKDGSIRDAAVVKGVSPELNQESLRVVSLFPNWIPGKQNGEVVSTRFVLPIRFR